MKWINRKDGIKMAKGKEYLFAYQKAKDEYLFLIDDHRLTVKLRLKTEADCKTIAKLLNK